MDHVSCPGAKFLRQPKPEIFPCAACGGEVEIWSDEIRGVCAQCGRVMFRDGSMGCVEWCKQAKECVGEEIYARYQQNRALGLRRRLMEAVQEYWGEDREGMERTQAVLARAEAILRQTTPEAPDWHIVLPASILHAVAGRAKAAAREILRRTGLCREDAEEIYRIAAQEPSPGQEQSANYRIVAQAAAQAATRR